MGIQKQLQSQVQINLKENNYNRKAITISFMKLAIKKNNTKHSLTNTIVKKYKQQKMN